MIRKVILIVDDEPGIRSILTELFELEDFKVLQADSGNKAFDLFKQNHVDCILSDIQMSDGSGVEMLKRLREIEKSTIPIFFMSGHTEHTKEKLLSNGAQEVFKKPFDIDSAIEKIRPYL